jgi:hypothetical protein
VAPLHVLVGGLPTYPSLDPPTSWYLAAEVARCLTEAWVETQHGHVSAEEAGPYNGHLHKPKTHDEGSEGKAGEENNRLG